MTDLEKKHQLDKSIQYFEDFINLVIPLGIEGVKVTDLMKNYNVIRNELSTLYVDLETE